MQQNTSSDRLDHSSRVEYVFSDQHHAMIRRLRLQYPECKAFLDACVDYNRTFAESLFSAAELARTLTAIVKEARNDQAPSQP